MEYAYENFLQWCDAMTIADEGMSKEERLAIKAEKKEAAIAKKAEKAERKEAKKDENRAPVSIKSAKIANDIKDIINLTKVGAEIIQIPKDMQEDVEKKIKAGKMSIGVMLGGVGVSIGGVVLCALSPIVGGVTYIAGLAATLTAEVVNEKKNGYLSAYRLYKAENGKMYLVHNMIKVTK